MDGDSDWLPTGVPGWRYEVVIVFKAMTLAEIIWGNKSRLRRAEDQGLSPEHFTLWKWIEEVEEKEQTKETEEELAKEGERKPRKGGV